jgi:DNA-binding NarL/FixJ family response regulator
MNEIRVLIADDHPVFRDGMHGLLDSVPDTEVVGEATSGEEVVSQAATLQPDVILMDIKRLCCKKSQRNTMDVQLPFLLCLGRL